MLNSYYIAVPVPYFSTLNLYLIAVKSVLSLREIAFACCPPVVSNQCQDICVALLNIISPLRSNAINQYMKTYHTLKFKARV